MSSKWPLTIATAVLLAGAGLAQPSYAGVVLSDDFAGTAQGNWPGDSVFLSILQPGNVQGLPSVDLVGPGFFANLAYGSGNSVDLDGSTGSGNSPAGELQSIQSLPLGNYAVSFLLAGNLRGATDQTTVVALGSQSVSFTPLNTQPYTLETVDFNGASGQLSFTDLGPSNQQGNLLANVLASTTPLPSTWTMLIAGFVGLGFFAYRGSKKAAVEIAAA